MTGKAIRLRYTSWKRFLKDYSGIKEGKLVLQTSGRLPLGAALRAELSLPGTEEVVPLLLTVARAYTDRNDQGEETPAGYLLNLEPGNEKALARLQALATEAAAETAARPVAASDDEATALPMDWLQRSVRRPPASPPQPEPTLPPQAAGQVEKKLSPEERLAAKPAADFIVDFTKAMLRSGYYDPAHPSSRSAKLGLHEKFLACLGNRAELCLALNDRGETADITVSGALEETLTARNLLGAGTADLFLPKLRDYFQRKGLLSIAIKGQTSAEEFSRFIDILIDPQVDQAPAGKVGGLFTQALVAAGIATVSTVFNDDLLALETTLPWRVELAIRRLAKDLKVLPMFKDRSEEEIRRMKTQIVQDIIRPLRHPAFLKDLVINCSVIARHVPELDAEDLEKILIASFPLEMLLSTSTLILRELEKLQELEEAEGKHQVLARRMQGVTRILRWIARRVIREKTAGAGRFLEQLYLRNILAFEDLPQDLQDWVNTLRMAKDVSERRERYAEAFLSPERAEDAVVLLKCFQRVVPLLLSHQDWDTLQTIARATSAASGGMLPESPAGFVFGALTGQLAAEYSRDEETRGAVDELCDMLGMTGLEVLSRVLAESGSRISRIEAVKALAAKGNLARAWTRLTLDNPQLPWFLKRNALIIMQHVGEGDEDVFRTRAYLRHAHGRLREEALGTMIALGARDAEAQVITALGDKDERVRHRALDALSSLPDFSAAGIEKLLDLVTAPPPGDKEEARRHSWQVARLLRALATLSTTGAEERIEEKVLELCGQRLPGKKGLLDRLRREDKEADPVLTAACTVLGKFGGGRTLSFLDELGASDSPASAAAAETAARIRERLEAKP